MKFIIKGPQKDSTASIIRKIGYSAINTGTGKISATRPLEPGGFPRFHIFLEQSGIDLILNIHVDQKKVSYKGVSAHSGEYDTKLVETEVSRIQESLR